MSGGVTMGRCAPCDRGRHGGGDRGDAETPGGAKASRYGRTSGSASLRAAAVRPEKHRRTEPSPCRPAPDHPPPPRVNHDASLFLSAAPASAPSGRHAPAARDHCADTVPRPGATSPAAPVRHSRPGSRSARGHSTCRRRPASGTCDTETGALTPRQPRPRRRRDVDERPHRQDTRPAFVPGTVCGTAPIPNLPG